MIAGESMHEIPHHQRIGRAGEVVGGGVGAPGMGLADALALVALIPLAPALLWALSIAAAVLG